MINRISFFDQSINNNQKSVWRYTKIANDNDVLAVCLLDYTYFSEHEELIAVD